MRRRRETSKVVLAAVLVACFVFTGIIIYGWLVLDRTDAAGLAGVILTPAATALGFYSWKAKAENEIKLQKRYGIKKELEE
jgi:hypothetical protein